MPQLRRSCCRRLVEALLPARLLGLLLPQQRLEESDKRSDRRPDADIGVEPELRAEFVACAEVLRKHMTSGAAPRLPQASLLMAYALYKQATDGDAPTSAPSFSLDVAATYKLRQWRSLAGVPPAEAMRRYISLVSDVAAGGVGGSGSNGVGDDEMPLDLIDEATSGMAGPVWSTPLNSAEAQAEEAECRREDARWPLHAAAREGDVAACERLVADGVSVDAKDEDAHTPLHWACDGGHVEAASRLIALGAEIDELNEDGATALHLACACGELPVIELLLRSGASTTIRDADGATAFEGAPREIREQLADLAAG